MPAVHRGTHVACALPALLEQQPASFYAHTREARLYVHNPDQCVRFNQWISHQHAAHHGAQVGLAGMPCELGY